MLQGAEKSTSGVGICRCCALYAGARDTGVKLASVGPAEAEFDRVGAEIQAVLE